MPLKTSMTLSKHKVEIFAVCYRTTHHLLKI